MIRQVRKLLKQFLRVLDDERIDNFQVMYYIVFATFAAMLLLLPGLPRQEAEDILAPPIYYGWLLMNLVCPISTLVGRRIGQQVAGKEEGEANAGAGAAWLRLFGDSGVWNSVNLWMVVLFYTDWWKANLFVVYFMIMGVFGGFMFTLRSIRRLAQIRHLQRRLP